MRARATYRSRTFDRHRLDLRIKFVVHGSAGRMGRTTAVYGRTRDISFTGIGVVLSEQLKAGTVGVLVMRFPKVDYELQLPAIVTQEHGFRCGLQFHKLSGEQRLLIQKICKALPA